jgi:beta-galactosidase
MKFWRKHMARKTRGGAKRIGRFYEIGGAFFPEHHGRATWKEYAELLHEAGLSFVRIGEFTWDKMEPREGEFDFSWLDEVMALLQERGIRVIMCTPTAVPPLWACEHYPEIHPVREDGKVFGFGIRRYTCPTSKAYHRLSEGIVAALAKHYRRNPQVIGWQIDNEIGHPFCFCERCLEHFRRWCKRRFKTIERFNDALCTHFLGQTLERFEQIPFPTTYGHPGLWLTYHKFFSDVTIACFTKQVATLKRNGVTVPVTTNMMPTWHGYDHEKMGKALDVIAGDHYGLNSGILFGDDTFQDQAFVLAYLRGMKHGENIWLHESQWGRAGGTGNLPLPGHTRWGAFTKISLGTDLINFFRFDTCPSGMERDGYGLIGVHRKPGRIFKEVKNITADVKKIARSIKGTRPGPSSVAVLFTFENHCEFARNSKCPEFKGPAGNGYAIHLSRHFRAVVRQNIMCDIVYPNDDFSKYDVIIAPALYILSRTLAGKLDKFVAGGGTLLLTSFSGLADENARIWDVPAPAHLTKAFGIEVRDYGGHYDKAGPVNIISSSDSLPLEPLSDIQWIDELSLCAKDVEVLARFDNPFYAGVPALTRRRHGKGWAYYLGGLLSRRGYHDFYASVLRLLGLKPVEQLPEGLYACTREKGRRKVIFINNPNPEPRTFQLSRRYADMLTGEVLEESVTLKPFEVLVLKP